MPAVKEAENQQKQLQQRHRRRGRNVEPRRRLRMGKVGGRKRKRGRLWRRKSSRRIKFHLNLLVRIGSGRRKEEEEEHQQEQQQEQQQRPYQLIRPPS